MFCEYWWFHWAKRPNKILISSASHRMLCLEKRPLERIRAQICHFELSRFPLNRAICKIKRKGIYLISHHYLDFVCFWLLKADIKIHTLYFFTSKWPYFLLVYSKYIYSSWSKINRSEFTVQITVPLDSDSSNKVQYEWQLIQISFIISGITVISCRWITVK